MNIKKIFFLCIFITIYFITSFFTFAEKNLDQNVKIFRGNMGENFYKDIDESINALEESFYQREFLGGKKDGKITSILNKVAKSRGLPECFTKETTFEDIDIFIKGDIGIIKKILDNECTKVLGATSYEDYRNVIVEVHKTMMQKGKDKMRNSLRLIKSGIYSDGNTNNSSFDLIDDFLQIHNIIFRHESNYYWDKTKTVGDLTFDPEEFIKNVLNRNSPEESLLISQKGQNQIGDNIKIENPIENLRPIPMVDGNSIMCPPMPEDNESGLSAETYKALTDSLNGDGNNGNMNNIKNGNNNNQDDDDTETEKIPTNYKKKNDDNIWPCNEIFCIHYSVKTKKHNLLGGGEVRTIEGLVERSNDHLKPFANSNLEAKKMGVDNFEIGTLDLNLPDLFHVNINVRWESVPILDIKKLNDNKDLGSLTVDNMLEKYFIQAGLQYKRENDLKIYGAYDIDTKTMNKTRMHPLAKSSKLSEEFKNIFEEQRKLKIGSFDRLIQNEIETREASEIYSMFTELANFTKRIKSYSQDLNILIKKMKEIPSI